MKTLLLILALACSANAGQMAATMSGVVGLWHFNEGTGSTTASAASALGGSLTSTAWTSGLWGPALSFNGSSSVVTIANNSATTFTYSYNHTTISMWAKITNCKNYGSLFSKGNDAYENAEILSYGTCRVYLSRRSSNQDYGGEAYGTLKKDKWVHVVAVFDDWNKRAYINGVLETEFVGACATCVSTLSSPTAPIWIGKESVAGRFFQGSIDEVALFNRRLYPAEIQRLYTEGLGRHSNAR
ncbi:MAG: LamG domain-containing protein [Elusimicrobiales bacterium]